MKKLTKILLMMPLLSAAAQLHATTATGNLAVTATILSNCTVGTGTGSSMPFGNYSGTASNVTGSVTVTCTSTTPYNVGLGTGLYSTGTTTRQMANGTTMLGYNLYSDSGRTKNWGQVVGTDTVANTGSGSAQVLSVYGTIPASAVSTPGAYSDTVTITITY